MKGRYSLAAGMGASLALCLALTPVSAGSLLGKLGGAKTVMDVGGDVAKGMTLSDADVARLGADSAQAYDEESEVAPASNAYAKRLAKLTQGYTDIDGLKINYKVYLEDTINAFALPDGSVRVYSGLMNLMSDDELRFVLGHEIGHVKLGHTKARFRTAYLAQAARKGAAASGGVAAELATSELGDLVEAVIKAQHSQSNELESDGYGFELLKKKSVAPQAAVTALRRLETASGGAKADMLSSHPDSGKRAALIDKKIKG